ncbi:MAG: DUF805 domain-containing protein [Verrucomicrobia bacterium]|nr:DUF805 domain-containing protein [Verrucomicrobiota bacterium]
MNPINPKPPSSHSEEELAKRLGNALFPHRIGRTAFGIRLVVMISACMAMALAVLIGWDALIKAVPAIAAIPGLLFVIPLMAIYYASVLLPRVRDTGLPGGVALLALVPPINVVCLVALLFIPTNAFSASPTKG